MPTSYFPDGIDDVAQTPLYTLRRAQGDCEDWAMLLLALLKAVGVTAHMGAMAGHAAVFVPLGDPVVQIDWRGRLTAHPNSIPAAWPTRHYQGRVWLPLEATVPPVRRGLPGEHLDLIDEGIRNESLRIAY